MHDGQIFVLCIIALSIFGGTARSWFRAKAGLPEQDCDRRRGRRSIGVTDLAAERQVQLLSSETRS